MYFSHADVPYVPLNGQQNGRGTGCILQHKEAGQEQSDNRYIGSFGSRSNYRSLRTVYNKFVILKFLVRVLLDCLVIARTIN